MLMLDDECTMCGMGTGAFCDFYFIIFFVNRERTHIYIEIGNQPALPWSSLFKDVVTNIISPTSVILIH